MSDAIVPTLQDFRLDEYFSEGVLLKGLESKNGFIPYKQTKWQGSPGPVWLALEWGPTVYFGFLLRSDAQWEIGSNCDICRQARCWHVALLAGQVIKRETALLFRCQELADRKASNQWTDGREGGLAPAARRPEAVFRQWLADRRSAQRQRNTEPYFGPRGSVEELIFIAARAESAGTRLVLLAGLSRKLKTKNAMAKPKLFGQYSDERPARPYLSNGLYASYARWCASNFAGMKGGQTWSDEVADETGIAVLKELANGGRLYVYDAASDRPVGPARWGATRELGWKWSAEAKDLLVLSHHVVGGGSAFFGRVPLYADEVGLEVGPLDIGSMESIDAEQACYVPPIPRSWLVEHARSDWAKRYLPRPPESVVSRNTRLIEGVAPVPVLTVEVRDRKDVFSLALAFRYGDVLEAFTTMQDKIVFVERKNETIEVVRDLAAEEHARGVMLLQGLVQTDSRDWKFSGDKSAQIAGFRHLLETDFAALRRQGFEIAQVNDWTSKVRTADAIKAGFDADEQADLDGTAGTTPGLEFSMGFVIGGERYNLLPLASQVIEAVGGSEGIARGMAEIEAGALPKQDKSKLWVSDEDGRWIGLPRLELMPWLAMLEEIVAGRKTAELKQPSVLLSRIEALRIQAEAPELQLGGSGGQIIRELLVAKACTDPVEIEGFFAELEPFQRTGVRWMRVLSEYQLGGLLGDDRGLGKTVQCIGHLQDCKNQGRMTEPVLVVVPPVQEGHWERHLHRLAPGLSVLVLRGKDGHQAAIDQVREYDVVIVSWQKLLRDIEVMRGQRFSAAILDETEKIHNSATAMAKAIKLLNVGYMIALNGSPVENNFMDLWSVFDAVLHGLLGTQTMFQRRFRMEIEEQQSVEKLRLLRKRLAPFMLRRLKKDSGVTLPPVQQEEVPLRIKGEQANLYEVIRAATEQRVNEVLAAGVDGKKRGRILGILNQLRQVCCDPRLTDIGISRGITESAKMRWLEEQIPQMVAEGRRILVVCFFASMFDLVIKMLEAKGIGFSMIRAGVNKRDAEKAAFKEGRNPVFLLGLKSGGRGTDLPEADTVVHVDPWWNPKAHDQATDRAHRIGQKKTVLNIRLYIEGSFEERVLEIQERKRLFADSFDEESIFDEGRITDEDVQEMLRPLRDVDDEPAMT